MKNFFAFLSVCITLVSNAQAQHYELIYHETINSSIGKRKSTYQLSIDSIQSYYFQLNTEFSPSVSDDIIQKDKEFTICYSKNYLYKEILYKQSIVMTSSTVLEKIPIQTWNILTDSKKIGDYACQKATTHFRGRNYTAWFTKSLPVIGGPWKFDGLPGVILEITSDDGFISMIARTIVAREGSLPSAPVELDRSMAITWDAFCANYVKMLKKMEKIFLSKTSSGDEMKMTFESVEILGNQEIKISK